MMASTNGKIPAGIANIRVVQDGLLLQPQEEIVGSIERCSDRNAKVEYDLNAESVKVIEK